MHMSGPQPYIPLIQIHIYIRIYCMVPLQNPVPVRQPTDAMPWGAPRQMPNGKALDFEQELCSICICLDPPTYLLYRYIYIYICIYCIVPLQNPVPVQQPTDAIHRRSHFVTTKPMRSVLELWPKPEIPILEKYNRSCWSNISVCRYKFAGHPQSVGRA